METNHICCNCSLTLLNICVECQELNLQCQQFISSNDDVICTCRHNRRMHLITSYSTSSMKGNLSFNLPKATGIFVTLNCTFLFEKNSLIEMYHDYHNVVVTIMIVVDILCLLTARFKLRLILSSNILFLSHI